MSKKEMAAIKIKIPQFVEYANKRPDDKEQYGAPTTNIPLSNTAVPMNVL